MGNRVRLRLMLIRQIVFGISYLGGTVYIGFLCFNIQIDTYKGNLQFFEFDNLLKQ